MYRDSPIERSVGRSLPEMTPAMAAMLARGRRGSEGQHGAHTWRQTFGSPSTSRRGRRSPEGKSWVGRRPSGVIEEKYDAREWIDVGTERHRRESGPYYDDGVDLWDRRCSPNAGRRVYHSGREGITQSFESAELLGSDRSRTVPYNSPEYSRQRDTRRLSNVTEANIGYITGRIQSKLSVNCSQREQRRASVGIVNYCPIEPKAPSNRKAPISGIKSNSIPDYPANHQSKYSSYLSDDDFFDSQTSTARRRSSISSYTSDYASQYTNYNDNLGRDHETFRQPSVMSHVSSCIPVDFYDRKMNSKTNIFQSGKQRESDNSSGMTKSPTAKATKNRDDPTNIDVDIQWDDRRGAWVLKGNLKSTDEIAEENVIIGLPCVRRSSIMSDYTITGNNEFKYKYNEPVVQDSPTRTSKTGGRCRYYPSFGSPDVSGSSTSGVGRTAETDSSIPCSQSYTSDDVYRPRTSEIHLENGVLIRYNSVDKKYHAFFKDSSNESKQPRDVIKTFEQSFNVCDDGSVLERVPTRSYKTKDVIKVVNKPVESEVKNEEDDFTVKNKRCTYNGESKEKVSLGNEKRKSPQEFVRTNHSSEVRDTIKSPTEITKTNAGEGISCSADINLPRRKSSGFNCNTKLNILTTIDPSPSEETTSMAKGEAPTIENEECHTNITANLKLNEESENKSSETITLSSCSTVDASKIEAKISYSSEASHEDDDSSAYVDKQKLSISSTPPLKCPSDAESEKLCDESESSYDSDSPKLVFSSPSPNIPPIVVQSETDSSGSHLSINKLKDITSNWLASARSRDITFTVPPSLSPLSPRRPFPFPSPNTTPRKTILDKGGLSPMSPRRSFPDPHLPSARNADWGLLSPRRLADTRDLSPDTDGRTGLGEACSFSQSSTNIANLGTLDPELYKTAGDVLPGDLPCYPDDHLGRVWYRLEYRDDCEKLIVSLLKLRNLPSRSTSTASGCDPYVKLVLMPDERRCLQTRRRQGTCNPRYDQTFAFMVGAKELPERALKVTVYDVDRNRKHNVLGHAIHYFKEHTPIQSLDGREVFYRDLGHDESGSPRELGQVEVTLCYNDNLDRLTVILGAVKGVKIPEDGRGPGELQVRVSLLQQAKVIKTKKSGAVRTNAAGETGIHESFMFRVTAEVLDTAALTLLLHQARKSDNVIGRVQLGSFMFARGRALDHWNQMLAKKREHVMLWHTLT